MILTLLILYLKLIACSIIGLGFQMAMKNKSMTNTANKANLEYPGFWGFVKQDQAAIYKTTGTITLLFLIFGRAIHPSTLGLTGIVNLWIFTVPKELIYEGVLSCFFATAGYVGQDYALRVFSVTDAKLKNAIDHKTDIADKATGTIGQRTPAE